MKDLIWVEISAQALKNNIQQIKKTVGDNVILCPCVKGNAYGHGIRETAKIFSEAGANWFAVNALYEAKILRDAGIVLPIYVMGYVPMEDLRDAVDMNVRLVVYNRETVEKLAQCHAKDKIKIHLKIETGNNRQGILLEDVVDFAKFAGSFPNIEIEGMATHFANIEDTTDHAYAEMQLMRFHKAIADLEAVGINISVKHSANSAATLLFSKTHFDMVRPGIICYGLWPSNETFISYRNEFKSDFQLFPALTWKTRIAQIKTIKSGEYVGYGCTFRTTRDTRLAILPVGYYDGYDRGVVNGYVLIHGKRAFLRGRVCMNIIMVDVTEIPEAHVEDEVILIGGSGDEKISAEQFAGFAGTINYEAVTRINERIPRVVVD